MQRHERAVGRGPSTLGRSTLMDCRPSVHRARLASGAFQLELPPSTSCHRRRKRARMDPVRSNFGGRGWRRVTSPRRAAAYANRDAFHHLEPTHGSDCSLLESRQSLRRTPSAWDVARRSTHAVLSRVPVPRADTPSMASAVRPEGPRGLISSPLPPVAAPETVSATVMPAVPMCRELRKVLSLHRDGLATKKVRLNALFLPTRLSTDLSSGFPQAHFVACFLRYFWFGGERRMFDKSNACLIQ